MMATETEKPLFTVIIPVKNRAEYLYHTLRTCSLQDYENMEVIVSDDGSTDNMREVVEEAARKDPRIRYISQGGIGMRDNFEALINEIKPGYVIALGGDDGLLPYGISNMWRILKETGQEILSWPAPIYSYTHARTENSLLSINVTNFRPKSGVKIVKSKDFLERQVRHLNYSSDIESPMFYVKGVVSTRLIDKVKGRSADGRFYACSTPDGYSGIVLAGEVETYAYSEVPFSIFGLSPSSQGLGYLGGDKKAKELSESFFKAATAITMHEQLASQPYSPLISLMTADYLLTAKSQNGWPGEFPPIDFKLLITKGINELKHGLYAENRLDRELSILSQIAKQHGLTDFFEKSVAESRRFVPKKALDGNAISKNALFFDSDLYQINNVFDAAYVAHYIHTIAPRLGVSKIWNALLNSIRYRFQSLKKGERFPEKDRWTDNGN